MRVQFGVAMATLLLFACASSNPSLPKCPPVEKMQPPPSEQCRSDPDLIQFESQLSALIEDDASPLRVRVEFDSQSVVQSICAERTSVRATPRIQREMLDRTATITSNPPGPPCIANSRLDFNWQGVQRAAVTAISRQCQRETRREPRALVDCLEFHQRRNNQIWIFDQRLGRNRVYVFYETPDSTPRERAIDACSRDREVSSFANYSIPIARVGQELNDCMRSEGWTPVPTH